MNELDIVVARLVNEERYEQFPYDDATGFPVKAPVGNVTAGYGCNVQAGWSQGLAMGVLRLQVQEVADAIDGYAWYQLCNAARRSVFLDIAFNDGVSGFVRGFPLLEAAVLKEDWVGAEQQCAVRNPKLKARYAVLAQILLTGVIAG